MKISVWAPNAERVTGVIDDESFSLVQEEPGYWNAELEPGTRYQLRLDSNDLLLPDPRSMCQPEGAHGPSMVIDPAQFEFQATNWECPDLRGKVLYELHIGTFTSEGTFRAAIAKLDHLVDLGVDAIELLPINPIPGTRGWGYDSVSIFALNHHYGTPEDLVAFIDAAHQRGIAVCLDIVYNHFGPDGNYLAQFGPYFTGRHHTPWGETVNFDGPVSGPVRQYVIDNALMWVRDYLFDALRLDATDFFIDDSPRHILADLSDAVHDFARGAGRNITLIAESNANSPLTITPVSQGGWGMDMQWADDVHHALHVWLTGETNAFYVDHAADDTLPRALTEGFTRIGQYSVFEGHAFGHPLPESVPGHALVVSDENHDQVGNRLVGDRPSHSLPIPDVAISRALTLLSPYTPMLFMGEEWAASTPFMFFTDHGPDIGQHIKAGREKEFESWDLASVYTHGETMIDPQDIRAFTRSKLRWDEKDSGYHQRLNKFVAELIRLRKAIADLGSSDRSATSVALSPDRNSGWMRRGDTTVVFARHADTDVFAPVCASEPYLSWDKVEVSDSSVHFVRPGVIVVRAN